MSFVLFSKGSQSYSFFKVFYICVLYLFMLRTGKLLTRNMTGVGINHWTVPSLFLFPFVGKWSSVITFPWLIILLRKWSVKGP